MPRNITVRQARNAGLRAAWAELADSMFDAIRLTRSQLDELQAGMDGYLVLRGTPQYDKDRKLFNGVFDYYPAIIAYCASEEDIRLILAYALATGLGFQLRSGGHCTAGFSAGSGVLLDVSLLNDCTVNAEAVTATVGCGCSFKKLYATLRPHGLHVPAGECEDVCVGGFVQGGGYGFTSATFGMNCDNVISMRVMLANGSVVVASEAVNSDLWWAMRGGTGGNFGVLLQVVYQLRPLGPCFGWALIWPLAGARQQAEAVSALAYFQSEFLAPGADPKMNTQVSFCFQPGVQAGALADTPTQPYLLIRGLYVGSASMGLALIAGLRAQPGAITQWTETASYDKLVTDLLNRPYSMPYLPDNTNPLEDKVSRYVARPLAKAEWRAMLERFLSTPNPYSYGYLEVYGGAIRAYPRDKSAFIHRDVLFNTVMDAFWMHEDGRPAARGFIDDWTHTIAPMSNGHVYQNYPRLGDFDYAHAYWGQAAAGLYAVKRKYDPDNAFAFQQQVRPMTAVDALPDSLQAALDQPIVMAMPVAA